MITTAGDELLKDIIQHPDDDTLRLVYADWLEDSGDRLQAVVIRHRDDTLRARIAAGEYMSWMAPPNAEVRGMIKVECPNLAGLAYIDWRSGFIEGAGITLAGWLEHGPTLVRQYPLRRVVLVDRMAGAELASDECVAWGLAKSGWEISYALPAVIFNLLSGPVGFMHSYGRDLPGTGKRFPGRDAANDALSTAALKWVRS